MNGASQRTSSSRVSLHSLEEPHGIVAFVSLCARHSWSLGTAVAVDVPAGEGFARYNAILGSSLPVWGKASILNSSSLATCFMPQ